MLPPQQACPELTHESVVGPGTVWDPLLLSGIPSFRQLRFSVVLPTENQGLQLGKVVSHPLQALVSRRIIKFSWALLGSLERNFVSKTLLVRCT